MCTECTVHIWPVKTDSINKVIFILNTTIYNNIPPSPKHLDAFMLKITALIIF